MNGQDIPVAEVSDIAMRIAGPKITSQLVGNLLVDQMAHKRRIMLSPAEVDRKLREMQAAARPRRLDDILRQRHMTRESLRDTIRVQLEVEKLLAGQIKSPRMAHVRDILIPVVPVGGSPLPGQRRHSLTDARAIIARAQQSLRRGVPFANVAREYSEDAGNRSRGGDIGVISAATPATPNADPAARAFAAQPAFLKAVFSLQPGQVDTKPIRTAYGLHLIEVVSTDSHPRPDDAPLYAAARRAATDTQLAADAPRYVQSLREAATVSVFVGTGRTGPPGVAATVNGVDIPLSRVSELALREVGSAVTNNLVVDCLVDQQAARKHVAVASAEVDARIDKVRLAMRPETLESALANAHMRMDEFRHVQTVRLEVEKLIAMDVPPIPMAHVRLILVAVEGRSPAALSARVAQVQRELATGVPFQTVARRYSDDASGRLKGGDIGIVSGKSAYDPALVAAALTLKPGEVSREPVSISHGQVVIQAISTSGSPLASDRTLFAEAERQARDQEVAAEMHDYVPTLRASSKIVVYLDADQ